MDSAVSTAARALAMGDPLLALKHVALRADPPALALRGVAMAQLNEWPKALTLLRRAANAFGDAEPIARARCVVAGAEVSLVLRDLRGAARGLDAAVRLLERKGDIANVVFARLVQARRLILLGQVEPAAQALGKLRLAQAPARLAALASLVAADVAMKRLRSADAEQALDAAERAAAASRIAALQGEVETARRRLNAPVARLFSRGSSRPARLSEVEVWRGSGTMLVDACLREARQGARVVSLVTRPVLLELLVALAEVSPREVERDALIVRLFGARRVNESHRVRLRVEVGRLRKLLARLAEVRATVAGFALVPRVGEPPLLLLPPEGGEASELWALLRGGEAWATSALASALGKSQRSVQRALAELEAEGKVRATGAGRARRWVVSPSGGFATSLLLVAPGTLG